MSLAIVHTRARTGIQAPSVSVEVHLSNGLPSLNIVGLPETAVRESKDRVRSAILNAHFEFPARRITINLAPADLPKEGGRFDLAIALGILAASGQVPADALKDCEFLGELSLSGDLRPVTGVLPASLACGSAGRPLILPAENAAEAALSSSTDVLPANHLLAVCAHLHGNQRLTQAPATTASNHTEAGLDLNEVIGQQQAKRALEIAAAGAHNLLFAGPPGTGKTMLASRLPGILPPLSEQEALQTAAIYSVAGQGIPDNFFRRPFRSPHHTASAVALVGGGSQPRPGEISLAHHGVLFLDELPEFPRKALEVMREPLERGEIMIARANRQVAYPSLFQLVAAMNLCPCGHLGDDRCQCTPDQIRRYKGKISGPLLDRIDLQVQVNALPQGQLTQAKPSGESSATIRQRVIAARSLQLQRNGKANAQLSNKELNNCCQLNQRQRDWLDSAIERLNLSARAYHRILKVARTIADLEESKELSDAHLAEAVGYRLNTDSRLS
ncbi:YifB family Mg chelatase-like AAA ATPase [Porticoccus sp. W117]|uniref:YifB family Mg chelatase-like AAA ATPase n=1 Tax=Porticoccus sp. W117 TaxID=3054777 RepID=UPI00259ADEF1|nr:YifB family Mg chelatase-like AAA ATPase [Porticoccus sp. W117]MDM3872183.1 YifB family Mg chelatase-like AAA ATPase [Porticoccus sp. W117]